MKKRVFPLMELFQVYDVHFLQMAIFLHLTTPTAMVVPLEWGSGSLKAVASYLRFLIAKLNGLADLFLFFGERRRLCDS